MERRLLVRIVSVVAFCIGWVACLNIIDCVSGLPSPSDQAAVAAYEAEQLACVEEAGTRLQADRCRCAVHERYGRPCTWIVLDGGLNDGDR